MTEVPKKTEDLWNPYKDLYQIISRYLNHEIDLDLTDFETILRQYKQNFISLLQNPPKNAKSREELRKGMVEGITVRGIGHQVLSRELYQEAIILSDMYDMNEFVALDLLCTAQIHLPYYLGLPRGLVAVLLYYDGRKALVSSLRMLVQARRGVLWRLNIQKNVQNFLTSYTDQLYESGLFNRIFHLLKTLDLSKEIEKLQQNVALGGPKHRRRVIDLFNEIRVGLSEIIFMWSAQSGLPKATTLTLINYLRESKIEEESTGKLDNVNLYLIMSFLYAVDLSILHTREDGEEVVQNLPILSESDFMKDLINEMCLRNSKWNSEGLQATCLFGIGVCLSSLRLIPQNQCSTDGDEKFVDMAIELQVFDFIKNILLENEIIYTDQFMYKRLHYLLTDFIVQMYSKIKELRMRADETARTMQAYSREGLDAPANLPRYFEQFLLTIAKFYSKDPLGLEYMLEYWNPLDANASKTYPYGSPPRTVSLFKFIKLGGEMLPATLFVPYLKMLSSLSSSSQTARYCFNMLKQSQHSFNPSISWDHFFISLNQYYVTLRLEVPSAADTIYRRNMYLKGITPQEIEGLHAVLLIIRTVAEKDTFSRLALCEHPAWSPLTVLLGLVSCSIPIPLKAELLSTLASLALSPEIASQMWNNLEASQILITIPSTSSYQPRGIETELEEIESRMEEYPLTRAVLKLLDVLVDSGIPRTLGAGLRKPGFDPYLNFIINSVFLKFHTRCYKSVSEKWQVANLCLKLIEKFLSQYEPQQSDFPKNDKQNEFNSPPGFHIMVQMNSKTEFLNLILYVIDEGCKHFDAYVPFAGQKFLEDSTLSCLNIIEGTLQLQMKFFTVLSMSSTSLFLSQLNKLLLTINHRSGRPDHGINILKYVGYQNELPNHTLVAIKILLHITNSPTTHSQFMNIILSYEDKLVDNFIECLDENKDTEVIINIKEMILKLLKQCLNYRAPNMSHYLFGFDLRKDISKMQFQLPGVLNTPRTCLHSLFLILRTGIMKDGNKIKSSLLESAYHMLYLLVSNSKTSEPVLKYIRMQNHFFNQHLQSCADDMNQGVAELNQLSWLLKTIAIELKVMSQSNQVFYLQELRNLLTIVPKKTQIHDESSELFSVVAKNHTQDGETISIENNVSTEESAENFLMKLISQFDLNVEEIVSPKWEYFDNATLETLFSNCETSGNPKLIDIKKLHQIILDELSTLQSTAAIGQRQAILQEIQKVLVHVLNINNSRNTAASIVRFVDGWRQVAEVIVLYMPFEIFSAEEQQHFNINLLLTLLKKCVHIQLLPEISNLLSGAVLLLIDSLRKTHIQEEKLRSIASAALSIPSNVVLSYNNQLREILDKLIQWIVLSNVKMPKLRINLYAAFVSFLRLITVNLNTQIEDTNTYVSRLDNTKINVESVKANIYLSSDFLSTYGEKLIESFCHDFIGGNEICKMLAMTSFSSLVNISGNVGWIAYMSGRGYLKCIIESILNSDAELQNLLDPVPTNLKPLYLYESKMSLLTRIADTRVGSELLLEQKLLSCFNNMKVYGHHPEISKEWQHVEVLEDFVPPIEKRYLQIWLPAFNICNAILTNLGNENQSAVSQIIYFILSHLESVEMVLRAASPYLSPLSLKEVAYITSVIARTANNDLVGVLQVYEQPHDCRAYLFRIQKLMLGLLNRFILTDTVVREVLSNPDEKNMCSYQTSERLLYTLQIITNLLLYSRNLIANHGIDHAGVGVIFQPYLTDSLTNANYKYTNYTDRPSTLGVIVQQLINTVQYQHREKITYETLSRKLKDIPDMTSDDLKEFIVTTDKIYDLIGIKERALDVVSEKLKSKREEMECCAFIIESSLYIIWAHLDYYMLKAIPKAKNFGFHSLNTTMNLDGTLASSSEATWKVSTDDISNLKQGLVSIFNDIFSKQLIETAEDRPESDRGLIEVLIRKIKRLIQFVPVK